MAKVIFMDGIASISGKLGDVVFRKSASGKTYMAKAPQRTIRQPSKKEIHHQQQFGTICKLVNAIMSDPTQRAAYEQLQRNTMGAQKMTLRKFLFQKMAEIFPFKQSNIQ